MGVKLHLSHQENTVREQSVQENIWTSERDWRKLQNELHNLYTLSKVIRVIKWWRVIWAGHVARIANMRTAYTVKAGKHDGKDRLWDLVVSGTVIWNGMSGWGMDRVEWPAPAKWLAASRGRLCSVQVVCYTRAWYEEIGLCVSVDRTVFYDGSSVAAAYPHSEMLRWQWDLSTGE
jgi:hypothetical protein